MCQVEQLPRGCLLEPGFNGCHSQSYKCSDRMSGSAGVRNRANGAVKALCSSADCSTSVRLESTEQIWRGGGGEKVLVTGGAGFFGFRLGKALARQGISVILLDLHQPRWEIPDGAVFLQVSLTSIQLYLQHISFIYDFGEGLLSSSTEGLPRMTYCSHQLMDMILAKNNTIEKTIGLNQCSPVPFWQGFIYKQN